VATLLLASYKVTPELALVVRAGFVDDAPPGKPSASAFLNPALGATYVVKLGNGFRLAPFLGVALPLGNGGGNTPDPNVRTALGAGMLTRSSMDNALFAVNYLTPFPGIDLAWVKSGLTIQAEMTLFELIRADACRCARRRPELITVMIDLLDDLNHAVARSAACALGQMGRIEARPMLICLLGDEPSEDLIDAISSVADEECIVLLGRVARNIPALSDAALDALEGIDHHRANAIANAIRGAAKEQHAR